MNESHRSFGTQRRGVSPSSSPLPPGATARGWGLPPSPPWLTSPRPRQDCAALSPQSRYFDDIFCSSQSARSLVPLSRALGAPSVPRSDLVKMGYLGKLDRSHMRYFVLRAGSHTGPGRLEWYKNQESFAAVESSASAAALFGTSKQGLVRVTAAVNRVRFTDLVLVSTISCFISG